jgi:hypothetical protein
MELYDFLFNFPTPMLAPALSYQWHNRNKPCKFKAFMRQQALVAAPPGRVIECLFPAQLLNALHERPGSPKWGAPVGAPHFLSLHMDASMPNEQAFEALASLKRFWDKP